MYYIHSQVHPYPLFLTVTLSSLYSFVRTSPNEGSGLMSQPTDPLTSLDGVTTSDLSWPTILGRSSRRSGLNFNFPSLGSFIGLHSSLLDMEPDLPSPVTPGVLTLLYIIIYFRNRHSLPSPVGLTTLS